MKKELGRNFSSFCVKKDDLEVFIPKDIVDTILNFNRVTFKGRNCKVINYYCKNPDEVELVLVTNNPDDVINVPDNQ